MSAIQLSEMISYCKVFDVDDIEHFVRTIRSIDIEYRDAMEGKRKKTTERGK